MARTDENKKKERLGMRNCNSRNQWFEIIAYFKATNMTVKFDCGEIAYNVTYNDFKKGTIRLPSEKNERHGERYTKLWKEWNTMKWRCNPKNKRHHIWYSDKGIRVCNEWDKYTTFREWALKNGFQENLTIDRIDHTKNYCPENCRWITQAENISDSILVPIVQINKATSTKVENFASITDTARRNNISLHILNYNLSKYNKFENDNYIFMREGDFDRIKK